ncbi:PIN domain-like protein [Ephemerocybe angulata]|uniref:PIN domain-like protein n=1 Tax=Ephemerocybe angulata TaxID=980116 RepID=A0A8H6IDJ9_9AGAR|nr:PIN domain-like protein [Tulosesus angulatus]
MKGKGSWARIGRETELGCLRMLLSQFLAVPATVVMVFDGPERPTLKRGRHVRIMPHQLEPALRELSEALGFTCVTAPGEAEAYLAFLNKLEKVHYVFTPDSDVFVFGARDVIRRYVYRKSAMLEYDSGALSTEGLIFIAVVGGGDYGAGLKRCGFTIAAQLARHTALPSRLCTIFRNRDLYGNPNLLELMTSLSAWRESLQRELEFGTNAGRQYKSLAESIPASFPNAQTADLYINPVVGSLRAIEALPNWDTRFPGFSSCNACSMHLWLEVGEDCKVFAPVSLARAYGPSPINCEFGFTTGSFSAIC